MEGVSWTTVIVAFISILTGGFGVKWLSVQADREKRQEERKIVDDALALRLKQELEARELARETTRVASEKDLLDRLRELHKDLQVRLDAVSSENRDLKKEVQVIQGQLDTMRVSFDNQTEKIEQVRLELAKTTEENRVLKEQVKSLEQQIHVLENQIRQLLQDKSMTAMDTQNRIQAAEAGRPVPPPQIPPPPTA